VERKKRLRVFAGPNGSGKTSLFSYLQKIHAFNAYYHINPDQIAADMAVGFNINNWPVDFSTAEVLDYLTNSPFQKIVPFRFNGIIQINSGTLSLKGEYADSEELSYLYAALGDFLRHKMLASNSSFSFETVFSHPSKIEELRTARERGFVTYLYFISTDEPEINLERVRNRVEQGGHSVPEDKIRKRYLRTMENLFEAFRLVHRVYFFDNSSSAAAETFRYFAEKRDGKLLITGSSAPSWFEKSVLSKLDR
jgi:predicted ABC-type ATPase